MRSSGALCTVASCELVATGDGFCARHWALLPAETRAEFEAARGQRLVLRRIFLGVAAAAWIDAHEHAPRGRPPLVERLVERIIAHA